MAQVRNSMAATVYYGESTCQKPLPAAAKACTKKAYYLQDGRALCGMHSQDARRQTLPKNPYASKVKDTENRKHQDTVDMAREQNHKAGRPGDVVCSRLRMMRKPDNIKGYLKVFPNLKHQNRKDGYGCAALSPMLLGPVNHHQKGLPPARNLENYHQFNKVYACEAGRDGQPKDIFYKLQLKAYKSSEAKRHKYDKKKEPKTKEQLRTLYSLHKDTEGKEKRYDYIQSRYLYCHFYETLAKETKDFVHLTQLVAKGTNVQIVGFDGYDVTKDLQKHYEDASRPFGHELCLYTMLKVKDARQYPWNQYYQAHRDLYPQYLAPSYDKGENKDGCLEEKEETLSIQDLDSESE